MSFYVPEQLEEEKAVEEIFNNAVRCWSWLCISLVQVNVSVMWD